MVRAKWSFLLEAKVETPTSLQTANVEDSVAGIVEEGLQPESLRLGAPLLDNLPVVEVRKNVRLKLEKKWLRKKPWETAKTIEVTGYLGIDGVDMGGPRDCVINDDSQELEGTNLLNLIAFDT